MKVKCPECGYPHAEPPKCRACGAEIKEESPMVEEEPSEEEEEESEDE